MPATRRASPAVAYLVKPFALKAHFGTHLAADIPKFPMAFGHCDSHDQRSHRRSRARFSA